MGHTPPLPAAVRNVVGDDVLVEVAADGEIAVLRSARATRDIALLQHGGPDPASLLDLADRLAWLDGRAHAPEILASGRTEAGGELVVVRLHAEAATAAGGMHAHQPEALATLVAQMLRRVHALPVDDETHDASVPRLRGRAAARVERGLVESAGEGPYAGRDPVELLAILDDLLAEMPEPDGAGRVFVHGRPTLDHVWVDPSGGAVFTGWASAGLGDPHLDLAVAAASFAQLYGPATVAPLLDSYGLDDIDLRRLDAHQLLAHLLA